MGREYLLQDRRNVLCVLIVLQPHYLAIVVTLKRSVPVQQ